MQIEHPVVPILDLASWALRGKRSFSSSCQMSSAAKGISCPPDNDHRRANARRLNLQQLRENSEGGERQRCGEMRGCPGSPIFPSQLRQLAVGRKFLPLLRHRQHPGRRTGKSFHVKLKAPPFGREVKVPGRGMWDSLAGMCEPRAVHVLHFLLVREIRYRVSKTLATPSM